MSAFSYSSPPKTQLQAKQKPTTSHYNHAHRQRSCWHQKGDLPVGPPPWLELCPRSLGKGVGVPIFQAQGSRAPFPSPQMGGGFPAQIGKGEASRDSLPEPGSLAERNYLLYAYLRICLWIFFFISSLLLWPKISFALEVNLAFSSSIFLHLSCKAFSEVFQMCISLTAHPRLHNIIS